LGLNPLDKPHLCMYTCDVYVCRLDTICI
jgi:hypothetical protein